MNELINLLVNATGEKSFEAGKDFLFRVGLRFNNVGECFVALIV